MPDDRQNPPEFPNSEPNPEWDSIEDENPQSELEPEPSFWKVQLIRILQGIINLLEGLVERLETPQPTVALTEAELVTQEATEAVAPEDTTPVATTVEPPPPVEELPEVQQPTALSPLEAFWDGILARVRAVLPQSLSQRLSDWALTGAIASTIVVALVTTVALLPQTPQQATTVQPSPSPSPPSETIKAPPQLTAPTPPQPVASLPPPPPVLTPEQTLIATIQNQVARVSDRYGEGMIQSIEANFLSSRLIVKISDDWYGLSETQQNQLADDIFHRSQGLDFSKLELIDSEGELLARDPVVGLNMVIVKREDIEPS